MKVSIETIYTKKYTVIYHDEQLFCKILGRRLVTLGNGVLEIFREPECLDHIATALPPLPRNPKPEDAPLLYAYMAEGLTVYCDCPVERGLDISIVLATLCTFIHGDFEITHATLGGERVEIAITDRSE